MNTDDRGLLEFPRANIAAVCDIATILESTFGPRSRDKLIVSEQQDESEPNPQMPGVKEFVATSDGATILNHLPITHPVKPVLRRMVGPEQPGDTDVEGKNMPDGVVSRVVLTSALLQEAESLLDLGLHPQSIVQGYQRSYALAHEELLAARQRFSMFSDPWDARVATAKTAMTGNEVGGKGNTWAEIAVKAVRTVGTPNEETFVVRKTRDGMIDDSQFVRGAVLNRSERVTSEMPSCLHDATVLVLDGNNRGGLQERNMSDKAIMSVRSPDGLTEYNQVRRNRKRQIVRKLVDVGVDVVVTRLGIDRDYQRLLEEAGIFGIRGVTKLDLKQVALATGASPIMDPTDVTPSNLGDVGTVEEVQIEPYEGRRKHRRMVVFSRCSDPQSVAIIVRGVSGQLAAQATTTIRKAAFAVGLADGVDSGYEGVVPGGGAIHARVADTVRENARQTGSREQLAMEAFADASESLVAALARNGGLNPITTVADIRAAHQEGQKSFGLVFPDGTVADCLSAGVLDPVALVDDAYLYATDIATMILCIDDTLDAKVTQKPSDSGEAIYDDPAQ